MMEDDTTHYHKASTNPPLEASSGDLWYSLANNMVYSFVGDTWVAVDHDGDVVDTIRIKMKEDPESAYNRAMKIL